MRRQSFMGRLVSEIFCPDFGPAAERMGNKMPAYFNLSLQFRRENLYPDFVKDFFDALCRQPPLAAIRAILSGQTGTSPAINRYAAKGSLHE